MKALAILTAWLAISAGALLAALSFPLAWALDELDYARNCLRALDKAAAAYLGFSGRYTVSAECGASLTPVWRALGLVIDLLLGKGHCREAAVREGLIVIRGDL